MEFIKLPFSLRPPPLATVAEVEHPEGPSLYSPDSPQCGSRYFIDSEDLDLLESISCEDHAALLPIIRIAFPFLQHVRSRPFPMISQEIKSPGKLANSVPRVDDPLIVVPLASSISAHSLPVSLNEPECIPIVNTEDDMNISQTPNVVLSLGIPSQLSVKSAPVHKEKSLRLLLDGLPLPQERLTKQLDSYMDDCKHTSIFLDGTSQDRLTKQVESFMDGPKYTATNQPITASCTTFPFQASDLCLTVKGERGVKENNSTICVDTKQQSGSALAVEQFERMELQLNNHPMTSSGFECNKKTEGESSDMHWKHHLKATCMDKHNACMENSPNKGEDHGSQDGLQTKMVIDVSDTGPLKKRTPHEGSSPLIEVPSPELMNLSSGGEGNTPVYMEDYRQRIWHGLGIQSIHMGEREMIQNQFNFPPRENPQHVFSLKLEPTQDDGLSQKYSSEGLHNQNLVKTLQDYSQMSAEGCYSTAEGIGGWHSGDFWARILETPGKEEILRHALNPGSVSTMTIDDELLQIVAEGSANGIAYSVLPSLACTSSDTSASGQAYEPDEVFHEVSVDGLLVDSGVHTHIDNILCTGLNENNVTPNNYLDTWPTIEVGPLVEESDSLADLQPNGSPYLNENDMQLDLHSIKVNDHGVCQDQAHLEEGAGCGRVSLTDSSCDKQEAILQALDLVWSQDQNQHIMDHKQDDVLPPERQWDRTSHGPSTSCRMENPYQADDLLSTALFFTKRRHAESKTLTSKRQRLMGNEMLAFVKLVQTASPLGAALFDTVFQSGGEGVTARQALDKLQDHANLFDSCQSPETQVREALTRCPYVKEVQSHCFIWKSDEVNDRRKIRDASDASHEHLTNLIAPKGPYTNTAEDNPSTFEKLLSLDEQSGHQLEEHKEEKKFASRTSRSRASRVCLSQTSEDVPSFSTSSNHKQLFLSYDGKELCNNGHELTTSLSSASPAQSGAPRKAGRNRRLHGIRCEKRLEACRKETSAAKPKLEEDPSVASFDRLEVHSENPSSLNAGNSTKRLNQDASGKEWQGDMSLVGTPASSRSVKFRGRQVVKDPGSKRNWELFERPTNCTEAKIISKTKKLSGMHYSRMSLDVEHILKQTIASERQQGAKDMPSLQLQSEGVVDSRQQLYAKQTSPTKRFDVNHVRLFSLKGKRSSSRRKDLLKDKKGVVPDAEVRELRQCNRTDGKHWRCSRYARPGLKYCERHMSNTRKKSKRSRSAEV